MKYVVPEGMPKLSETSVCEVVAVMAAGSDCEVLCPRGLCPTGVELSLATEEEATK